MAICPHFAHKQNKKMQLQVYDVDFIPVNLVSWLRPRPYFFPDLKTSQFRFRPTDLCHFPQINPIQNKKKLIRHQH